MFRRNKDSDDNDSSDDAPPLKPFASKGTHTPSKPPTKAPNLNAGGASAASQKRPVDIPSVPNRLDRHRAGDSDSKRLVVGRDIRLSGEIAACERLVVEGHVEVSLAGARLIEVAPSGVFKGSAEVEDADISGHVDGELVVSNKLTVRSGGRISGSVHYGSIIIEAGGEVSGDMHALDAPAQVTPEKDDTDTDPA
ncbi:MAG: polymer-forming cytoskeletal protein [Rhodospirillaceae bacterium]|jgi:cytoskeletal protein CcmA (bactofilin family)|nr:polymer-forming cytoskeletal protein [Rhodospirillaceae bacterium]MBT5243029.1 polymer-forming cytoskeletal protein [Rhodospirillaceae bacterium]MBT5563254.1 polymer-forming cytoskeletal protein [Rhodospirillaceae bacterium]MBT6243568.1 polymer-forming cytoskeletal protein [Rhodospirillaceae bacterium]